MKYNGPLNRVLAVIKNSPAHKAGIQEGDVILRIGARNVDERKNLGDYIQKLGPNRNITIKVRRGMQEKFIRLTLGKNKDGEAVLGVINTPKRASTYKQKQASKAATVIHKPLAAPNSKDAPWANHYRNIQENKAKMEEQARNAAADKARVEAQRQALSDALAKTKADAAALKAKNDEATLRIAEAEAKAKDDNYFLQQAKSEMEGVQALLADMKGADALLQAKALRAKLRAKNLQSMEDTAAKVNEYLNANAEARAAEETISPITTRRISWRRVLAATTTLAGVAGAAGYLWLIWA